MVSKTLIYQHYCYYTWYDKKSQHQKTCEKYFYPYCPIQHYV